MIIRPFPSGVLPLLLLMALGRAEDQLINVYMRGSGDRVRAIILQGTLIHSHVLCDTPSRPLPLSILVTQENIENLPSPTSIPTQVLSLSLLAMPHVCTSLSLSIRCPPTSPWCCTSSRTSPPGPQESSPRPSCQKQVCL